MPLPLTTERLLLRPATLDDLETWLAIATRTAWWGEARSSIDDARANLQKSITNQGGVWIQPVAGRAPSDGRRGQADRPRHLALDHGESRSGIASSRDHWGHGYASEAATAAVGFDELGLDQVVAVTMPTNEASRRR